MNNNISECLFHCCTHWCYKMDNMKLVQSSLMTGCYIWYSGWAVHLPRTLFAVPNVAALPPRMPWHRLWRATTGQSYCDCSDRQQWGQDGVWALQCNNLH